MPELEELLGHLRRDPPYPPTPLADIVRRGERLRRASRRRRSASRVGAAAVVGALVGLAALTLAMSPRTPRTRVVVTGPGGAAVGRSGAAALQGLGQLAYVAGGQLYVRHGGGGSQRVPGPGTASQPAWSTSGAWLAFLRTPVAPPQQPYATEPSTLWVVRVDGQDAHPVTSSGTEVDQFAWGPAGAGDALAVETTETGSARDTSEVFVATPTSGTHRPVPSSSMAVSEPATFAWAPSGRELAVSEYSPGDQTGWLELVPLGGGKAERVYQSRNNALEVASWWPDGGGLLFWLDTGGSASVAADGLSLASLDLSTGQARVLATTLLHPSFLAWSPAGTELAVVAGGSRSIWDSGKHLELCRIPSGSCTAVAQPADQVSLDPTWMPDGELVFARAPGTTSDTGGPPPGLGAGRNAPPYSSSVVERWYDAQSLWTIPASGGPPQELAGPGAGSHAPAATASGVLYVDHDQLWYLPDTSSSPVRVATAIGPSDPYAKEYYGYVDWASDYAWHP